MISSDLLRRKQRNAKEKFGDKIKFNKKLFLTFKTLSLLFLARNKN